MQVKDAIKKIAGWRFHVPIFKRLGNITGLFSFTERFVFRFLILVVAVSVLALLWKTNDFLVVEVPARGGSIIEGVVGTPRFINPLLALSDADRDLTSLVYSGLMKATPYGDLIPDLADSFTISEDGLRYIFILRDDIYFHDNEPVTADDVVFTIQKAQDSTLKSPKRPNWEGVSVEKLDDKTVQFTLGQPYSPFLENTTIGLLPEHMWQDTGSDQFPFSELNVNPIGSGAYQVTDVKHSASGVPMSYTLKSFKKYALGEPFVNKLIIRFYPNEEALLKAYDEDEIKNVNAVSPERARALATSNARVETYPLPRVFGVFFNQNQSALFTNSEVREALSIALDKERVVEKVLNGYGTSIDSPLPPGVVGYTTLGGTDNTNTSESMVSVSRRDQAQSLLLENGWEFNEELGVLKKDTKKEDYILRFSISTSNAPELKQVAEIIKEEWEAIGAQVELQFFDIGSLNQEIIRPRKYDSLLFGQIIGRDLDPFAFWHSSQRNDPGLNIALYANITTDNLLEKIRTTFDKEERTLYYKAFEKEIKEDAPAIFVYSPDFIYIVPENIKGLSLGTVTTPSERFLNIHEWYIETDRVWSIFTN